MRLRAAAKKVRFIGNDPDNHVIVGDEPGTASVTIPLQAGTNTIKVHNDDATAPDLDRLTIPLPG